MYPTHTHTTRLRKEFRCHILRRATSAWGLAFNCFHAQSLAKVTQLQDLIFGEENIRRLQVTENDATLASELHPTVDSHQFTGKNPFKNDAV